jgi:hypothetical protein
MLVDRCARVARARSRSAAAAKLDVLMPRPAARRQVVSNLGALTARSIDAIAPWLSPVRAASAVRDSLCFLRYSLRARPRSTAVGAVHARGKRAMPSPWSKRSPRAAASALAITALGVLFNAVARLTNVLKCTSLSPRSTRARCERSRSERSASASWLRPAICLKWRTVAPKSAAVGETRGVAAWRDCERPAPRDARGEPSIGAP